MKKNTFTKTALRAILGFYPKNINKYRAALIHPSYRNENPPTTLEDFDRLEFLGDAILNEIICHKIYRLYPGANEGLLSRLRSILVSRKILSRIALSLKLDKKVILGKGLKKSALRYSNGKILGDIFEALIAVIYFDKGKKQTEKFILKHYKNYFNPTRLFKIAPNPKSALQELTLKIWKKLPEYHHSNSSKKNVVSIKIAGRKKISVKSKSRREGEIKAAKKFIAIIRKSKSLLKKIGGNKS